MPRFSPCFLGVLSLSGRGEEAIREHLREPESPTRIDGRGEPLEGDKPTRHPLAVTHVADSSWCEHDA